MGPDVRVGDGGGRLELDELRRRMAAIPGRDDSRRLPGPHEAPGPVSSEPPAHREVLAVPPALAELLPGAGLEKGSVIAHSGARSLLAGLLAAVTENGGYAALVGLPRFGLLAAAEMGAVLERVAVVADPGPDPLEVVSVLLDGLDLVVLGLAGAAVLASRARVIAARARAGGATLVVADGHWPGPALRMDARVCDYTGLGAGRGRLRSVCLDIDVRARTGSSRSGRIDLCPAAGRVEWIGRGSSSGARPSSARSAVS